MSKIENIKCRSESDFFQPRFNESDIQSSLTMAKNKFANKQYVVLTNLELENEYTCKVINCNSADPKDIQAYSPDEFVFIYACDIDEIGEQFIRVVIEIGAKYIPVRSYLPSLYHNIHKKAAEVLKSEYEFQSNEGFLKWGVGSFFGRDQLNIMQAIDMTANICGDFVEIGCFRGSTSRVSLSYMSARDISRNCYFLDVFDGFAYEAAESSSDALWYGTHETEGKSIIEERLKGAVVHDKNLQVNVIRNNIIEDEFPEAINKICLAYIDVDLYEAVYDALTKVAPKLVSKGIIVVEDPGHTPALIGARLALDEFLNDNVDQFTSIYLESGQTYLIKV